MNTGNSLHEFPMLSHVIHKTCLTFLFLVLFFFCVIAVIFFVKKNGTIIDSYYIMRYVGVGTRGIQVQITKE